MNTLFPSTSSATFSPCGKYRYTLTRQWSDAPTVAWILLNPSTADAEKNDPTIRRVIAFSKAWGHGGMVVLNLFALRSTDPRALVEHYRAVIPEHEQREALDRETAGRRVIAAWGVHGSLYQRAMLVSGVLREHGVSLECLGHNSDGSPKHPLYVRGSVKPVEFGRKA